MQMEKGKKIEAAHKISNEPSVFERYGRFFLIVVRMLIINAP